MSDRQTQIHHLTCRGIRLSPKYSSLGPEIPRRGWPCRRWMDAWQRSAREAAVQTGAIERGKARCLPHQHKRQAQFSQEKALRSYEEWREGDEVPTLRVGERRHDHSDGMVSVEFLDTQSLAGRCPATALGRGCTDGRTKPQGVMSKSGATLSVPVIP